MTYTAGSFTGNNISATNLNTELQKIELAFSNYLSRVATDSNSMEQALDMNDHGIVNVVTDESDESSLVTLEYLNAQLVTGESATELASDIAQLQGNLTTLSTLISNNTTASNTNATDLAALQSTVASLQGSLTTLSNLIDTSAIEADIVTLQAHVDLLKVHSKMFSFQDVLPDSTEVGKIVFTKAHILGAAAGTAVGRHRAYASTVATSGVADFDIQFNGSSVGTISFAANSNVGTFNIATAQNFSPADYLSIVTGTQYELGSVTVTLSLEEVL